ncbi:MAG: SMP-30/gluconolactonase/LRE family protein [Thermomicrobiales bacterium]
MNEEQLRNLPRLMDIRDFAPFVEGLDHPEGVACGPGGEVFAGGEAGQIYRISPDGTVEQIASTGGFILGLCLDAASAIYACDMANHQVARIAPDGTISTWSAGAPGRPMRVPNYPVFDADGNLYVSDSGSSGKRDGCVFLVRPDGTTEVLAADLGAFPNGLALDAAGETLCVVLSDLPGVVAVDLRPGHDLAIRTLVELPRHVPDGLAFDVDGNLYISCYTPDVIYRLAPDGELAIVADDWASVTFATPTNIAFCGPERRTLVVASLSRWHLTRGEMPIAGQLLNYPSFAAGER